MKFTPRGDKGVATFGFGGSNSNYGQGEISLPTHAHAVNAGYGHSNQNQQSPVSLMSTQSNGEQGLMKHGSANYDMNVINIDANTKPTPHGDESDSVAAPPPPPPKHRLDTGDYNSNLNYNSDAHSHANSYNVKNNNGHFRNQHTEDSLDKMQHEFLSEEINNAEDRIQRGNTDGVNVNVKDGGITGEQMRATAGGPLSVGTAAMNSILPASPDEGPIPAPPPPPIQEEDEEDSDHSLYRKQHLFLQDEVNRKEDEEEEDMNFEVAKQLSDNGSGMNVNVTPM